MPVLDARTSWRAILSAVATSLLILGCARTPPPETPANVIVSAEETHPEWRNVAQPADIAKIDNLDAFWRDALATIQSGTGKRTVREGGALLDPAAALERPEPTPGRYICRVWRLPAGPRAARGFITYRPFTCFIDAEDQLFVFTKEEGSERPAGRLWPANPNRLIFLGAMVLGPETTTPAYGDDPARNLAGAFERIGAFRWRLILPAGVPASRIDVIELIPLVPPIQPVGFQ